MTREGLKRTGALFLLTAAALIAGCHGMYMHNPERAATAAVAKKNIEAVDIEAITKVDKENIAKLTTEAVKSLGAREKLVARLGVLQIAAGEETIERHYARSLKTIRTDLGTDDMFALKAAGDCKINQALNTTLIDNLKDQLKDLGLANAPICRVDMPASVSFPPGLSATFRIAFSETYQNYKTECAKPSICESLDIGGELTEARKKRKESGLQKAESAQAVADARAKYDAAVKENSSKTKSAAGTAEELQDKAQNVVDAVNKLAKVAPQQANRLKASALLELIAAATSGTSVTATATVAAAPSTTATLTTAAAREIASSIPSLAQSIATAKAAGQKVPTAHLLLALNDVLIVGERDDRLAELDEEEYRLLEQKIDVRQKQAVLWRRYSDQLCKLAFSAANKPAPSESCGTIRFTAENGVSCEMTLKNKSPEVIPNCILAKSWRSLFGRDFTDALDKGKVGEENKRAASRELHEAVTAYLEVRMNAYQHVISDFNRYDVGHRRVIVRREAALEQWKNIVAVPANELDAYYSGGVKPAEIADLLVKALGFTAVAIGASK